MAYRKRRKSKSLDTAAFRLNGLQNIDDTIDFGAGFTVDSYETLVEQSQIELNRYNALLSNVDKQRDVLEQYERQLDDANERVFSGIIAQFGRDSIEYEMVGGTRKSNIRNIRAVTYDPDGSEDAPEDDGATTP